MLTIGLLTICFLLITIKLVFDIFKDNLFELNLSSSLETVSYVYHVYVVLNLLLSANFGNMPVIHYV